MYEHITASGSLSDILTEMKLKSGLWGNTLQPQSGWGVSCGPTEVTVGKMQGTATVAFQASSRSIHAQLHVHWIKEHTTTLIGPFSLLNIAFPTEWGYITHHSHKTTSKTKGAPCSSWCMPVQVNSPAMHARITTKLSPVCRALERLPPAILGLFTQSTYPYCKAVNSWSYFRQALIRPAAAI